MKLTAIILLSACLTASANGHSQGVTIVEKNVSLEKVFTEIRKQTGYNIVYTRQMLEGTKKMDIQLQNVSVQKALEECLKDQPLTYTIINYTIIIKPKEAKSPNGQTTAEPNLLDVHGRVTNENGEPVAATIAVKGTKSATATDADGNFDLKGVDENATLVITGVSIETREMKLNGKTEIAISVKIKIASLNEVIVNKGYYTEKQGISVANVTHISKDVIEKQPVQNPLLALEGRVPGLFITQSTGLANGYVNIRVQGQNSIIDLRNQPLIVIDGVPYPSTLTIEGNGSPISGGNPYFGASPLAFVNPSDIESIDVLKDADATAIYGSRAGNGAILITTKKGKVGKTRIDVNLQQGWGGVTRKLDMLNTRQYLDMRYEALRNDGIDINTISPTSSRYYDLKVRDTTRYTDWQKTLIGETAKYSTVNVSVSAGTSLVQYLIGGTFNRTTDVFPGNLADKKGALHFNLTGQSNNNRFKIQLTGSYGYDNNKLPGIDLTSKAVLLEPVAPALYNPDGTLNWAPNSAGNSTWENPLVYTTYRDYEYTTKNLLGNMDLSYKILRGLTFKSSFGYSNLQHNSFVGLPLETLKPEDRPTAQRAAQHRYFTASTWIIEPQINYVASFRKAKIEALVGSTIQKTNNESISLNGTGYSSDLLLHSIGAATSITAITSNIPYKYNAASARMNISWDNKYIINMTARRDGSSRFGDKNKLHNFGSLGMAWIFSKERWMEKNVSFLSQGKIRASVGTTGNDQVGDYSYLNLYSNISSGIPYQGIVGLQVTSLPNPYLQWQDIRKWQAGIDLGFLKDRILFGFTYQQNRCTNQLLGYPLPSVTGFSSILENLPATVQNTSIEFTLFTQNIESKNFNWSSSFNLTMPRNKLVAFPGIEKTVYANRDNGVVIGKPLGVMYVYQYYGVDPATGSYMVVNKNGTPTSSPDYDNDRTQEVSLLPSYYGGLQNSIKYKGFQLDFLFQIVRQKGPKYFYYYNQTLMPGGFFTGSSNQPVTVLNRWQKPGNITSIARFNSDFSLEPFPVESDAGFTYEASYVRLKNLSLSWQIPVAWLKKAQLQNGQIYLQGQNLATITKYAGLDPENLSSISLPPLKMWTVGIRLSF